MAQQSCAYVFFLGTRVGGSPDLAQVPELCSALEQWLFTDRDALLHKLPLEFVSSFGTSVIYLFIKRFMRPIKREGGVFSIYCVFWYCLFLFVALQDVLQYNAAGCLKVRLISA